MTPPASDDYFDKYSNLQRFKHELLRRYLNAWFPILATTGAGRLLYIETHAGRGRHETGEWGSPLVALKTLLEHRALQTIVGSTEVTFSFIEDVEESAESLRSEVTALGKLPERIKVHVLGGKYETVFRDQLVALRAAGKKLAPAFVFVDPFSFMVDADLLRELMAVPRCEILYNFMWENARQAIGNKAHAANMDAMFGPVKWSDLRDIPNEKDRCDEAAERLRLRLGAKWHRTLKCYGTRNSIKYVLLHFTNADRGYEKMNEAMWAIDPGGTFSVSQRSDPRKDWFFVPEASIAPLKDRLAEVFRGRVVRYDNDVWHLAREAYLPRHCRQAVMELIQEGRVALVGATKLIVKDNPQLQFC